MIDQSYISFAVYEDATEFLGMAEATMPDLSAILQTITGAGIAGNIEAAVLGHFDAMTLSLSFRTITEQVIKLATPKRHNITLRVAQQNDDAVDGITVVRVKHSFVVVPKKLGGGKVAPASPGDVSGEYAVYSWKTEINDVRTFEYDPLNYICFMDGVDYLEKVRTALGK